MKKQKLKYGIIEEYTDGTILWFEPVTDTEDGFVLRNAENESILKVYREPRIEMKA